MQQISNTVYCEDFILDLDLATRLMPNQYYDLPYLLIEGFLSQRACDAIARQAFNDSEAEAAKVKTRLLNAVVDPSVDKSIRKTVIHKLPEKSLAQYYKSFTKHQQQIEDYFSIALTTATKVQALEYTQGDFYIKHADDSSEIVDKEGKTVGFVQVAPQRKISTVLFTTSYDDELNDNQHFNGGELVFNYLFDAEGEPISIRPKAGDMLVFPSNPIYSHEVMPVKEGYRLTLVQWHNGIIA